MRQNERHLITLMQPSDAPSYFRATCVCGWKNDELKLEIGAREEGWKHLGEMQELGQRSLTKRFIYLASPHSHTSAGVRQDRYVCALNCLSWLLENGFWAFSPIVHCHNLPLNQDESKIKWDFWKEFDTETITRCDEVWILLMNGTLESKGVKEEVMIARLQGKKVMVIQNEYVGYTVYPLEQASPLVQECFGI